MRRMRSLALATVLTLAACGGQDSGGGDVDTGPGAASGEGGAGMSATAERCLDLVADGRFSEAVDPCTRAVRESPASQELADALDEAREGVAASAGQAGEAAREAAEDAQDAAGEAMDGAQSEADAMQKKAGDALAR